MSSYVNLFNQSTSSVDLLQANQIYVADGNATSPSIAFILDPSTGIFREANGTLSITSSGIETIRVNNGVVYIYTILKGTAIALTGNLTAINIQGTTVTTTGNIISGGLIEIPDGSATNPSLTFSSDNSTGIFKNAALTLGISSNGALVAKFNTSAIQMYAPLAMGTLSITCGGVSCSSLLSSGTMSCGTNSLSSGSISSSGNISCTGDIVIGNSSFINTGFNRLQLYGTDSSSSGPHLQAFTSTDNYPLLQILPWTHNNVSANFDAYFDSSQWRSSYSGSNFQISKYSNALNFNYDAGIAQGSIVSWSPAYSINSSGQSSFGTNPITAVGSITSSGNFSNGSHSMTTGSLTSGNIGINTAPDATMALKAQITGSDATGLELASLGTSVGQKIQFYDENSTGTGPYINFDVTYGSSQIRSTSNIFLCAGSSTPVLEVGQTSVICLQPLIVEASLTTIGNPLTCGSITSSGTFSNGTNSLTCGAITSSGTFSNGTHSLTCGAITSGSINAGTNSISCGSEVIGSTSFINAGSNILQLYGTDSSTSGPNTQVFTSIDNYPLFQQWNWTHNNVALNFDMYYDGNWRSSLSSSNFNIYKQSDQLQFNYNTGTAKGSTLTFTKCGYFDTSGSWNLPTQPCVQYSSSTYMSVNNATATIYNLFNTSVINQGSGITVSSGSTFTVSIAGIYQAFVEIQFDTSSSGTISFMIIKNGNSLNRWGTIQTAPCVAGQTFLSTNACLSLAVNDYLQVLVYQTSGANLHIGTVNTNETTRFTLIKVA